jgi:site-specific DNA recombinase
MKRVAIYARISSVRAQSGQTTEATLDALGTAGVDRQIDDCRQKAADEGLTVVAEFVDNNKSAYDRRKKRPEWEKLKGLIEAEAIEGIVVWHTDRLYRHPSDLGEIIDLIETGAGLEIFACKSGKIDLNTSSGKMVARILGDVAWQEVEHKAERQSRQILETARHGLSHGGPIPVGYKKGRTPGERIIDEEQAATLREMARRYLDEGASLNAITEYGRTHLKRPALKPISVRAMLTRPAVIGVRQHVPVAVRNRHNSLRSKGKATGDVPDAAARYPATWPAIFDEETHARLIAGLFDPKNARGGRTPTKSMLSGVLKCGLCGTGMGYSKTSYKCSYTSGGCAKISISTKGIEKLILGFVPQALSTGMLVIRPPEIDRGSGSKAQDELALLEKKKREYHELFKQDHIRLDELDTHLVDLDRRIGAIEKTRADVNYQEVIQRQVINGLAHWETSSDDQKRGIIRSLFQKVVIMPSEKGKYAGPVVDPERVRLYFGESLLSKDQDFVVMSTSPVPEMTPKEKADHDDAFREWQREMDKLPG